MNVLSLVPNNEQKQSVVDYLREALTRAEAGEIIGIVAVEEHGSEYVVRGSSTLNRLQMAGALLDAAVTRLK